MHIYKCINKRTKTHEKTKHITIIDTKEKEYTHNMTILIGLLRFGEKNNNTIFSFFCII